MFPQNPCKLMSSFLAPYIPGHRRGWRKSHWNWAGLVFDKSALPFISYLTLENLFDILTKFFFPLCKWHHMYPFGWIDFKSRHVNGCQVHSLIYNMWGIQKILTLPKNAAFPACSHSSVYYHTILYINLSVTL